MKNCNCDYIGFVISPPIYMCLLSSCNYSFNIILSLSGRTPKVPRAKQLRCCVRCCRQLPSPQKMPSSPSMWHRWSPTVQRNLSPSVSLSIFSALQSFSLYSCLLCFAASSANSSEKNDFVQKRYRFQWPIIWIHFKTTVLIYIKLIWNTREKQLSNEESLELVHLETQNSYHTTKIQSNWESFL